MRFITQLIVSTLAVFVTSYILPGVHVDNMLTAIIVAAVLAFLNSFLKPLMILFTIRLTVFSLGLFLIIINAIIIVLTDKLVNGFEVDGFGVAILFSIVLWIVTVIFESLTPKKDTSED